MKEEMQVTNERYRLSYHLMTKGGWMNDPNGLSYFKGYYHIFYQYHPYSADWGPMHWGHARSKDMLHWETLPTALVPGDMESGCFSGSAVEYEGKLWLIYTGHHYIEPGDGEAFYENQNLAYSEDGIHFTKYEGNPVLRVPADNTKHFRDPKVWREGDEFFMVLGSQGADELGRALLYKSKDLKKWERISILAKANGKLTEGYMWECPDFFKLDGKDVLLMSPQGVEPDGDKYHNLNQTGYIMGELDPETYELNRSEFIEIDNGHDFYATQTLLIPDGRRIMLAWMNAWDSPMYEKADGWAGALTIPRELTIKGNYIYQQPIKEMVNLRQQKLADETVKINNSYNLPRAAEISLNLKDLKSGEVMSISDGTHDVKLNVDWQKKRLILNRNTKDGERATSIEENDNIKLQVFVDKSSVEIFVNDGAITFTERIYFDGAIALNVSQGNGNITIYELEAATNKY